MNYNLYNIYNLLSAYNKYNDNPTMTFSEPNEASCPTLAGYTTKANNKLCLAIMKKNLEIGNFCCPYNNRCHAEYLHQVFVPRHYGQVHSGHDREIQ
jgi:hypothetical protein